MTGVRVRRGRLIDVYIRAAAAAAAACVYTQLIVVPVSVRDRMFSEPLIPSS